jgi:hypothetical protein
MSLINETLSNLQNSRKDDVVNPSSSRQNFDKNTKAKSPQNILIMLISIGIVLTLFYITYNFQISRYYHEAQQYISTKSAFLIDSTSSLRDKFTYTRKSAESPKSFSIKTNTAAQIQYYNAMNLLNEGKDSQARIDLLSILEQYPDFEPAKNAYNMLNNR